MRPAPTVTSNPVFRQWFLQSLRKLWVGGAEGSGASWGSQLSGFAITRLQKSKSPRCLLFPFGERDLDVAPERSKANCDAGHGSQGLGETRGGPAALQLRSTAQKQRGSN